MYTPGMLFALPLILANEIISAIYPTEFQGLILMFRIWITTYVLAQSSALSIGNSQIKNQNDKSTTMEQKIVAGRMYRSLTG